MNTATMKKTKGQPAKQVTPYLSYLSTPARTRTADKLIKSQLLYQLSYGGTLSVSTLHLVFPWGRSRWSDLN